jgi:hypothetical protein
MTEFGNGQSCDSAHIMLREADNYRFDYDPGARIIIIKMPTPIHECFLEETRFHINLGLDTMRRDATGVTAILVRDIKGMGSTNIPLASGPCDARSPACSYGHKYSAFPHLVIEISYSQNRKNLCHLAVDYIVGSGGGIGTVIGFDIEHQGTKAGRVLVWRLCYMGHRDGRAVYGPQLVQSEVCL